MIPDVFQNMWGVSVFPLLLMTTSVKTMPTDRADIRATGWECKENGEVNVAEGETKVILWRKVRADTRCYFVKGTCCYEQYGTEDCKAFEELKRLREANITQCLGVKEYTVRVDSDVKCTLEIRNMSRSARGIYESFPSEKTHNEALKENCFIVIEGLPKRINIWGILLGVVAAAVVVAIAGAGAVYRLKKTGSGETKQLDPNVKYSPFFQSNANQPMPLNADWLRIGRKCQCLTNPFEMDRIGNFGLEPQIKPIRNQSLIIKPML